MNTPPDVFFLPADGEQRLCLFHAPAGEPRSRVLYLHPFAEEMNKSRRTAALACRALAEAGHAVLQIDLRGCGDSSADFGDASWTDWQADVRLGLHALDERAPNDAPLWLWGLRAGCLLVTADWGRPVNYLFWQPMTSGKLALQQFLRLKVAAEMAAGASKGLMEQMKSELAAGRSIEIAGYRLGPSLASGLEAAKLNPAGAPGRVEWLELSTREDALLTPASEQAIKGWQDTGWTVRPQVVQGPSFWATAEIELAPALIARTVEALA
ncbi:hydrolase 2, exosortase A system-associated [Roseateles saccharophilus]|uniref:Exosortase A-associated hydrolase 2 n=1 Tax=Roseateles saccharophilus TaxID=304 RepID=A0A4R3UEU6_ROSSA|nr:hydrolase 2, exosortase A system-associated [Roseateles saccharophilus]MDG0835172.1 hydrolase 2, exosortase A system-associated [Roseateles saccharophilus]TCU87813.1 exosortase A-associated hydrolase 2 [Roseateles saccharophilus]